MASSIQSIPSVFATPSTVAPAVPNNAATIPTKIVSSSERCCFPGTTRRPSPPITSPINRAEIIPVISTRAPLS
jgi:hypothetical protein